MSTLFRILATEFTPKSLKGKRFTTFSDQTKLLNILETGDKVKITYYDQNRGGWKTSSYTVTAPTKKVGSRKIYVGIIGKGTAFGQLKGQGGYIGTALNGVTNSGLDEYEFQPTWKTQVRKVHELELLGRAT